MLLLPAGARRLHRDFAHGSLSEADRGSTARVAHLEETVATPEIKPPDEEFDESWARFGTTAVAAVRTSRIVRKGRGTAGGRRLRSAAVDSLKRDENQQKRRRQLRTTPSGPLRTGAPPAGALSTRRSWSLPSRSPMYCSCVFLCGTPQVWFVEPHGSATTCVEILRGPALFGEVQGIGAARVNAPGSGHRHMPIVLRVYDRTLGAPVAPASVSKTSVPQWISPRHGSPVPPSASRLSAPSRWDSVRSWSAAFTSSWAVNSTACEWPTSRVRRGSSPSRGPGSRFCYAPVRDARLRATDTAYLVGPYRELLDTLGKGQSASRTSAEGSGRRTP